MLKGLILKDIYSIRFQLISAFLLTILPNFILMMTGGGIAAGGGSGLMTAEGMNIMGALMYGVVNYITITVFSSFLLNTLEDDTNSGWAKIQRTMPVSGTQIIGGKIIATLMIIGLLVGISLIFNLAGVFLFGIDTELMIAIPLCCGLLQIITLCPAFPISMKVGVKFTNALYIGLIVLIAIGMGILLIGALSSDISGVNIRIIMYGALPAFAAAVIAVSFAAGKKSCETDL